MNAGDQKSGHHLHTPIVRRRNVPITSTILQPTNNIHMSSSIILNNRADEEQNNIDVDKDDRPVRCEQRHQIQTRHLDMVD